MEGRMTVCNMAIEAGARVGFVAADDKTIEYVKGRPYAPRGELWDRAVAAWQDLHSDPEAVFDRSVTLRAAEISRIRSIFVRNGRVISPEDSFTIPHIAQTLENLAKEGQLMACIEGCEETLEISRRHASQLRKWLKQQAQ